MGEGFLGEAVATQDAGEGGAFSAAGGFDDGAASSAGDGLSADSDAEANRQASLKYAHEQQPMHHVFDNPKHNLGALISSCGSEGATMDEMINSVQGVPEGVYGADNPLIRVINGYTVTIRGAMINGVFKISTAFIPN